MITYIYELYFYVRYEGSSHKTYFLGCPSVDQVVAYTQAEGMPLSTEQAEELLRSESCAYKGDYWMLDKQEVVKGEG